MDYFFRGRFLIVVFKEVEEFSLFIVNLLTDKVQCRIDLCSDRVDVFFFSLFLDFSQDFESGLVAFSHFDLRFLSIQIIPSLAFPFG
jgi:hypothetical protein